MTTSQNKVSHTPGPWGVTRHKVYGEKTRYTIDGEATTSNMAESEEARSNAILIATAPDLLEALKAIQAALNQNATLPADIEACRLWAKDAIAKVEGRVA